VSSDLRLVPLRPVEIAGYIDDNTAAYVEELVEAGMDRDAARAKAQADHDHAFPGGVPAEGHHVFALHEDGRVVGRLWLGPAEGDGPGAWWVFDIEVVEAERGRGLGRTLMQLAEVEVGDRGGTSLGLNVFGANHAARSLYESLGYQPTSIRMRKPIEPPGGEPD
jgi:ribosomal protein S18 acetylase RimI-like enzyme